MSLSESIELIEQFNRKHGLTRKNQTLQLNSEMGELSDEVLKRNPAGIAEELGDVLFVAYSIALLTGIDYEKVLYDTAVDNIQKDATKEGAKVTKDKEDNHE